MPSESLFTNCKHCGKLVQKSVNKCPSCGKPINTLSIIHWTGIVILGLMLIGMFNSSEDSVPPKIQVPSEKELKRIVSKDLKLEYSWDKEAFGMVMEADLTILNNSQSAIKDIEIQCDHYAKSGTKIDSNNREIYEVFAANSARSFANFNLGFIHEQVVSTSCYIKDFSLIN